VTASCQRRLAHRTPWRKLAHPEPGRRRHHHAGSSPAHRGKQCGHRAGEYGGVANL